MALERRERAVAHGDRVVQAYAAFGDPVTSTMQPNAPGAGHDRIQPAGVFSTAPYMPKGVNSEAPRVSRLCAFPEKPCRVYATETGYCYFHNQTMIKRGELEP